MERDFGALIRKKLEPWTPKKPFPDSLQISVDHWLSVKARGTLPELPKLGQHPEELVVEDTTHLTKLIKGLKLK